MDDSYFVAATPDAGIIGTLTAADVRRRLAAGSLDPGFVCLPVGATGAVAHQWRTLADVFGPDGAAGPSPGGDRGVDWEARVADAFLVFGQVFALVSAILVGVGTVVAQFSVGPAAVQNGLRTESALLLRALALVGGLVGFCFWSALFITFGRARRVTG